MFSSHYQRAPNSLIEHASKCSSSSSSSALFRSRNRSFHRSKSVWNKNSFGDVFREQHRRHYNQRSKNCPECSSSGQNTNRRTQKTCAVVDPSSSSPPSRAIFESDDQNMNIRCSIDGDDFSLSRREMAEVELNMRRQNVEQTMGGEMLKNPIDFVSTNEQRVQCAVHFGICGLLCARGVYLDCFMQEGGDMGLVVVAEVFARATAILFSSFVLADLGTGIFHWSVDNYGDKSTPIAGNVIDAFQGHHRWPWTITKRQLANNIHKTCIAPLFFTLPQLLFLGGSDLSVEGGNSDLFFGSFWALVVLSQQFHAWAHMKPSEQPKIVTKLQDMNILLGRKDHGAHHRSPFEGHYCIISGW